MKLIELAAKTVSIFALTVYLTNPVNASASAAAGGDETSSAAAARSLVFKDKAMGKDDIDFLRTQFPELEAESSTFEEDLRACFGKNLEKTLEGLSDGERKTTLVEYMCLVFAFPVYHGSFFEGYIPNKEVQTNTRAFDKTILNDLFREDTTVFDNLTRGARKISKVVKAHGEGSVLFLGRSPCWMQRVFEAFPENGAQSIHVSYSGTADAKSLREDPFFADQERNTKRNMVTPERLQFFEDYLTQQGLDEVKGKLYLVDTITTGASLNSFLRILRHYYTVHLEREMPDVHFIGQSLPCTNYGYEAGGKLVWVYQDSKGTLTFTDKFQDHGLRPLSIKATPLHLASLTHLLLDADWMQYYGMHGYYFPACNWNEGHREALSKGGLYHADVSAFLVGGLRKRLELDDVKDSGGAAGAAAAGALE